MEKLNLNNAIQCPVCQCSHVPNKKYLTNGVYAATCENCGHFFKFRTSSGLASGITLTVNGQQYTVGSEYVAATNLNHWLRHSNASVGTKYMCREGGCGSCVVTAKMYDPLSDTKKTCSIVSCLCPLFMCDGWEITTIEGLDDKGPASIPKRLAKYNGSQCGFCSPGQSMNMHGLLAFHSGAVTMQQVEDAYDGNICRCTGYRPILDAMKSYAIDSPTNRTTGKVTDIEELGKKTCKKTGAPCTGTCGFPSPTASQIILKDALWYKPTTVDELFNMIKQAHGKKMKLVYGNTGQGIYNQLGPWNYEVLIDIRGIRELFAIDFDPTIVLGAGLTLSTLKEVCFRGRNEPYFKGTFSAMYKQLSVIASQPIRNLASWGGNIMLKHKFDFASDLYVALEAANAKLQIADSSGPTEYTMTDFLKLDMTEKVLLCMLLPSLDDNHYIRCYKVMKRHQFTHAYVNAGIRMHLDKNNGYLVKEKPCIVFGGIKQNFNHAVNTEMYLTGKQLSDPAVITGALSVLAGEIVPDTSPVLSSAAYRKSVTLALLYRYFLDVLGNSVSARLRSGGATLERPLSSGQQSYGTKTMEWPVTEPMTKIEALHQTSGRARYINDTPDRPGELYASFVLSTVGNAKLGSIDASAALNLPGVVKFLSAKDIPGENNCCPFPLYDPEELFVSSDIQYCGQSIGVILAEDKDTADTAANMVNVTYTDVKPPILTIADAIAKQSFFNKKIDEVTMGDAEGAISGSARKITGSISFGTQAHFHMETQVTVCEPTEDGMNVEASTQWMHYVQQAIAKVCDIKESSIYVKVRRLGGSYGGKISRNFPVSAACALGTHLTNRPVRLAMDFHKNLEMMGKRFPYQADYEVGFTDEGKLNGVKITYYADCGICPSEQGVPFVMDCSDNAYHCDNWHMIPKLVKTNKPANTYCRSPGSFAGIFVSESILEHVAKSLGKDPTEVRKLNLYQRGQMTPSKMPLDYCNISTLVTSLEQSASFIQRQQEVATFNQANRWKKKGLSVVPMRFPLGWNSANYNHHLSVYAGDGSVAIATGGIESGQGLNTKVVQVAAYELGIPMDMITVQPTNTIADANSITTGGSVTSELCCQAIIECCNQIKARMAPVKAKMTNPTWQDLVNKCFQEGVDLCARFWDAPKTKYPYAYNSYGVTCTEVELDVLTGQHNINRVDMLYDCGESLNPEIDVGQAEGAFVMGLGLWLTEETLFDPTTGKNLTNGTWEYKPPLFKDIPIDFRIQLLKNAPNPLGVLRSKAVGEPPLCMSCSALFALKHAVEAARKEINQDTFFPLNGPATVEALQTLCLLDPSQFVIRDS